MTDTRVALSVLGRHQLTPAAAASFERLAVDVLARLGIRLTVRSSDRPLAEQEEIFFARYRRQASGGGPYGDVRHYRGVRYVRIHPAMAAVPGTSNHGSGVAVDYGAPFNKWGALHTRFRAIAAEHGWRFPIPSEAWHGEYSRARDRHYGKPVPFWLNVQRLLAACGHVLDVDGIPGPGTNSELKIFQAARGLEADAVPGPATMAALRAGATTTPPAPTDEGVWLTDLPDVVRRAGLDVVEVEGWQERGRGPMKAVRGIVAHHTGTPASRAGDYPSLEVVRDGHGALAGNALSHLGLGRSGTVYVIAAGVCWHAGDTDDPDYTNLFAIGIEAEHPGDETPWPHEQYDAYVRLVAALQEHYGSRDGRGHKEIAVPQGRKTDPSFDMNAFRQHVAAVTRGPAPVVSVAAGYEVAAVQEAVASLGGALGPAGIDGVDGPATKAAVVAAQKALGVHPDGVWGNNTQEKYMATIDDILSKLTFVEKVAVETLDLVRYSADKAGKTNDAVGRLDRDLQARQQSGGAVPAGEGQ